MLETLIQFLLDHMLLKAHPIVIYSIVALFLLLESCGIPVINSTLLLLTGALVTLGHLDFWPLAGAALFGSCAGACLAYWIGERGGRPALMRLMKFLRIDESKVNVAEGWFQHAGVWMIFLSRITPYVRPFACFLGGISRLNYRRFLLAMLLGSLLWCVVIIRVGMVLGKHWRWGVALIQQYTLPACLILVAVMVLSLAISRLLQRKLRRRFLQERSQQEEAERQLLKVQ
ncbi:DedA family protein [Thermogemmatispora onikobensis]|uniref:DedA family protein n=1 Tax=Thermogemmatispora onikobensis TaxID=732234 RepID=UPI000852AB60|nr:DedA family protein [Thermogemmatispora onikobensis]